MEKMGIEQRVFGCCWEAVLMEGKEKGGRKC